MGVCDDNKDDAEEEEGGKAKWKGPEDIDEDTEEGVEEREAGVERGGRGAGGGIGLNMLAPFPFFCAHMLLLFPSLTRAGA